MPGCSRMNQPSELPLGRMRSFPTGLHLVVYCIVERRLLHQGLPAWSGPKLPRFEVTLEREPTNQLDSNAIKDNHLSHLIHIANLA